MNTATLERPQYMQALDRANEIRIARAHLKAEVRSGEMPAHRVISDIPECAETMTIGELLRAQNRWGRTRARRFLVPLAINENRQIGRMTLRMRGQLIQALIKKQSH